MLLPAPMVMGSLSPRMTAPNQMPTSTPRWTLPMTLAVFSYWVVGIPASYVLAFPLGMGPSGVWLGLVIGLALASALLMGRFWSGRARRV